MPEQEQHKLPAAHEDAFEAYDEAWYSAIDALHEAVSGGSPDERLRASQIILEYSKNFTILGAPYVPSRPAGEEDDE